jgi:hypothetical protein
MQLSLLEPRFLDRLSGLAVYRFEMPSATTAHSAFHQTKESRERAEAGMPEEAPAEGRVTIGCRRRKSAAIRYTAYGDQLSAGMTPRKWLEAVIVRTEFAKKILGIPCEASCEPLSNHPVFGDQVSRGP